MEDGSDLAPTDIGRPKLRWSDVIRKDTKEKQPIDRRSSTPKNVEREKAE